MAIRPSSSAEIRQLIAALGGEDEVAREAAIARLAVLTKTAATRSAAPPSGVSANR